MKKTYQPSDLVEVATKGKVPPNCDVTLQIKATYAQDGVARGVWKVDERFLNGIGVVMGGYLTSAADIMMAYAVASKLADDYTFSSIDLHTTFHRPTFIGTVDVEARVERLGKKVAYVTADLVQNDKKVASVVSSVMIFVTTPEHS
ncbi:PaaI family thioesterase [Calidifontibacillus oryziterrae]|uniref:PaaI family thioesterase n=1 Tax=Calidifontibacillus oryziterrae TaxID=1191699 RepID=UPI0002DEE7DA|nr:PaaI family thioesterase [Calidifontibacillus oryziterrae]